VKQRPSGQAIVYSAIDVKNWAANRPTAEHARPGCCSRCGAASRPTGAVVELVGHGVRLRQVLGPAEPDGPPVVQTVAARRYRCRHCGGITTVLPRGLCARRHYSASAIGLSFCLYGLLRLTVGQTRQRICAAQHSFEPQSWTTLRTWLTAVEQSRLLPRVRRSPPSFSPKQRAERIAAALCAHAAGTGSLAQQAFSGAALAA